MINWKKGGPCRIAAIGECMIERKPDTREKGTDLKSVPAIQRKYSGDTLNTLTYMARLLDRDRAELFYITAVGADNESAAMLAAWEGEGINTEYVRQIRGKLPGRYTISTGQGGERCFGYERDKSAARELLRDDYAVTLQNVLKNFHAVCLSGISIAILTPADREKMLVLLKSLRKAGVIIVYDPNYRTALWASPVEARDWSGQIYGEIDVALPGFDDEKALFNDATPAHTCARLADMGITEVIVKNGSSPCTVSFGRHISDYPAARQGQVVDTTAAGDSFNAGYISARLSGCNIETSVRAGQSLASVVIQYPGAIIPRDATPSLSGLLEITK